MPDHTSPTFHASLSGATPPTGLPAHLLALWHDGHGDWDAAHALVDQGQTPAACHVHAYLHRKEGDLPNARYWYARAGEPPHTGTLAAEYASLLDLYLR